MKRLFAIAAVALMVGLASCDISGLLPSGSEFEFSLDGTSFEDDAGALVRVFGAAQANDSTVVQVSVPDASSGRLLQLLLVFTEEDGTKSITQGLGNATGLGNQLAITIFDDGLDTSSSTRWDATNMTMEVSDWTLSDDNLVEFNATFSGTVENADTEETATISNGVINIVGIR